MASCEVVKHLGIHKYQVRDLSSNTPDTIHRDRMKKTNAKSEEKFLANPHLKTRRSARRFFPPLLSQHRHLTGKIFANAISFFSLVPEMLPFVKTQRVAILVLDPAHLKPGVFSAHMGRISVAEDVLWVRYSFFSRVEIPTRVPQQLDGAVR